MFLPEDQVIITHCPANLQLTGRAGTLLRKLFPQGAESGPFNHFGVNVFSPSPWEKANAYWEVSTNQGPVSAYIRHDLKAGDDIIIIKAPIGWKELEGKVTKVETWQRGNTYRVKTGRGVLADVEDVRPLKPLQKVNPPATVVQGISKEDLAKIAVDIFDLPELTSNSGVGKLLNHFGVDLAEVEVKASTYVTLEVHEDVVYGKGIELEDKVAVAQALAKKFKSMGEGQLASYLLDVIEEITL